VAHAFGTQLSLIVFAIAAIQGLIKGAEFPHTIQTALLAMCVFYALGWILGELARWLVEENVRAELARSSGPAGTVAEAATR